MVFGHLCELATIALPHVLTPGAQPQGFVSEVIALLGIKVAPVEIALTPILAIAILGASEMGTGTIMGTDPRANNFRYLFGFCFCFPLLKGFHRNVMCSTNLPMIPLPAAARHD